MHFDGVYSKYGSKAGISLYNSFGNFFSFSYRLNFSCTNNVAEFETLLLGLENALKLGCQKIIVFGDSELIINLVRKLYTPSNKLMRRYNALVSALAAKFLSFEIFHVKRNINVVVDNLTVYATRPDRDNLVERPNCSVISLYHPHLPDNQESWQVFDHDTSLQDFLTNDEEQDFEVIYLEHNKYPKVLVPLESTLSTNDASKTTFSPENPKRKIDDTIPINIGLDDDPKNVYISVTCTDDEKEQFIALFKEFKDIFAWSYADLKGFDPSIIKHVIPIK